MSCKEDIRFAAEITAWLLIVIPITTLKAGLLGFWISLGMVSVIFLGLAFVFPWWANREIDNKPAAGKQRKK